MPSAPTATRCARWRSSRRPCRRTRSVHRRSVAGHGSRPALARRTRAGHEAAGRAGCARPGGRADPAGRRVPDLDQRAGSAGRRSGQPPHRLRQDTRPTLWRRPGRPRIASRRGSGFCRRTNPRWPRSGSLIRPCTCNGCTPWPPRPGTGTTASAWMTRWLRWTSRRTIAGGLFQLAFVLLNSPSLARPDAPGTGRWQHRAGGPAVVLPLVAGRPRRILGLTAFALAIRRLQGTMGGFDARAGVAVLMRYAAAAHHRAVPAGSGPGLRVRDDPPW